MTVKEVVHSGNEVGADITDFNERLGIQQDRAALEAKRWGQAVGEAKDTVVHTVEAGATATSRFSSEALANTKALTTKLSSTISERLPGRQDGARNPRKSKRQASSDIDEDDER